MRRTTAVLAAALAALFAPQAAGAAPTASATATPERGQAPLTVTFDGSGSDAAPRTIVSWDWDFGDGATASGESVTHEYAAPGLYTATLTVTDDLGATSSDSVEVRAQALTLALARRKLVFGGSTAASGALDPAEAGVAVVIEQRRDGSWHTLATPSTDGAGRFAATLSPARSGRVRARIASSGTASPSVGLRVTPRVRLSRSPGRAFLGAPLTARVRPLSYAGAVVVTVRQAGRTLGHARARVRDGRLRVRVPTPGVGRLGVRLAFPASGGVAARTIRTAVRSAARTLGVGSQGRDVRALLRRLDALRYRVPRVSTTFSPAARDGVVAFQKATGLARTGVVGTATWRALGRARVLRPRFSRPALHIEVDKTRQILLVVKKGAVATVLQTSTGATGNTPEGRWRIYWKTPGYNSLGMYYSMYFKGGFAVHGYASVPPYPASHGCARLPIWTASWLYRQSPVGETVYVYR